MMGLPSTPTTAIQPPTDHGSQEKSFSNDSTMYKIINSNSSSSRTNSGHTAVHHRLGSGDGDENCLDAHIVDPASVSSLRHSPSHLEVKSVFWMREIIRPHSIPLLETSSQQDHSYWTRDRVSTLARNLYSNTSATIDSHPRPRSSTRLSAYDISVT
ncbi:uncharacterized protein ARMOST_03970 [Armillaria ostoyae]|uniref:Uncharacterized protein n=1 Tax=Armillaria ostoyae TaxID=47428 RepID=A0A284QW07_ARMOS|nr:uncharacterized protein ARMOST_03970 [Armillaria ostoyae]